MNSSATKIGLLLVFGALGVLIFLLPTKPTQGSESSTVSSEEKVKQAIALVQYGGQPMQGIQLLREVLQENPNQKDAVYQLGVFSVQSQQWKKGLSRFNHLKELTAYRGYEDAFYFQALCYANLDSLSQANMVLDEALVSVQDTALHETLQQFKNTIINNL